MQRTIDTLTSQCSSIDEEDDMNDIDDDAKSEESTDSDDACEESMLAEGTVKMRPSSFVGVPGTVYFDYPTDLEIVRKDVGVVEPLAKRKLQYSLYWSRNCIKNAFQRAGFSATKNAWTAIWAKHQDQSVLANLNCLQKVNHFPKSWCIGRKDRLQRTIQTMKRKFPSEYDFHPDGFILPADRDNFERAVHADARSSASKKKLWIVKPVASSCGRGIRVTTADKALKISKRKKVLLQRYCHKPLLINGHKFDLRLYVLVAGVDPLRIYIHHEGLTRISTEPYALNNFKNKFAHLTNYSINKKSENFKAAEVNAEPHNVFGSSTREGYKWSLDDFKQHLVETTSSQNAEEVFLRMYDLVVKTIVAAESDLTSSLHESANYRTNCYELFGFDVLIDKHFKPHLIEVNISPSLMGSSPLDRRIKGAMVADVFHLVGIYPLDNALLNKYGTRGEVSRRGNDDVVNPFSFQSFSKLMSSQDAWRKAPCPRTVDMNALGSSDSNWLFLLMIEDEINRSKCTGFTRIHPQPESCEKYLGFYKTPRFSDHLLAAWLQANGSIGPLRSLIPRRFLPADEPQSTIRRRPESPRPSPIPSPRTPRAQPAALPTVHRRSSSCPRPVKSDVGGIATQTAGVREEIIGQLRTSRTAKTSAPNTLRSSSQKPPTRPALRSTEVSSVRKMKEACVPCSRAMQPIRARNLLSDTNGSLAITHNTKDKLLLRATQKSSKVVP